MRQIIALPALTGADPTELAKHLETLLQGMTLPAQGSGAPA